MNKSISRIIFLWAAFFALTTAYGQDVLNIADEGSHAITCVDPVLITSSNGSSGQYGANENYQITICVDASSESNPQIIISPAAYGHVWDVDVNASVYVYNGNSTSAPLVGQYNTANAPNGINIYGTGTCLTIVFTSGSTGSGAGFSALVQCIQAFQDFDISVSTSPGAEPFADLNYPAIKICHTDSIHINVATSYPLSDASGDGYEQSDETSIFTYHMGDGMIFEGTGLTSISYAYSEPFGYEVMILVTDAHGYVRTQKLYVLTSPRPKFQNLAVNDTLCVGQSTEITGGIDPNGNQVGFEPGTSAIMGGGSFGEQLYLPDGNNNLYETTILIDEFGEDQLVESASDIISFCVNMEHSYLGDLEMGLSCPDGTMIIIFNSYNGGSSTQMFPGGFGGGSRFLGDADRTSPNGVPGIGFTYCFSDNASTGKFEDIYNDPNYHQNSTVTPGYKIIKAGSYLPEESYESFIGCPLNGEWKLSIKDNWSIDDGFVFNWSIYFNPDINPNAVYYTPDIVDVFWEDNVDITANNGATITVTPSQYGDNSFTFVAKDEFNCLHDTTVYVYVRPQLKFDDAIACDLTHIFNPIDELQNPIKDGEFTILEKPTETADIEFTQTGLATYEAVANEYGVYKILMTSSDCGYTATAIFDYRPDPVIEPFDPVTALCPDATLVLDAGPQEANSDNFQITWISSNTGVFNTEDLAVTVDTTGIYYLSIVGYCGTAHDTTDVSILFMEYDGNEICGLESAASVKVAPPGKGMWSGPANISFSNPDMLSTLITSTAHGIYEITYTDDRCPEDGLTREFNFVEPPKPVITPEHPDFCVDKDPLTLVAKVGGSFNGTYNWSINGDAIMGQSDTLYFAPGHFDPLQDYLIEVTAFDDFGKCPPSVGTANFTGKWCEFNIPNVITPNGDSKNDTFYVENLEFFPGSHLRIFDRWGKKIFDQPDYDQYQNASSKTGWNPEDLDAGTYFYELLLPNVKQVESGYIEILKQKK